MLHNTHSFLDLARRFPRVCACLMRLGYLTESEAARWLQYYIQKRAGLCGLDCILWTDLNADNLSSIIKRMRSAEAREWLQVNVREVKTAYPRKPFKHEA